MLFFNANAVAYAIITVAADIAVTVDALGAGIMEAHCLQRVYGAVFTDSTRVEMEIDMNMHSEGADRGEHRDKGALAAGGGAKMERAVL